jgi:uncharacterized membrane protein YagU involved in acid resistance
MTLPSFNRTQAILWGGLAAGILDIGMVFAIWAAEGVPPGDILRAIASAVMDTAAYQGGTPAAWLGLFLHFFVSFAFAAAYVITASRVPMLQTRPVLCGIVYGLIAYAVMVYVVVPLSLANFGPPESMLRMAQSLSIHIFLFGLPIALAASRVRR